MNEDLFIMRGDVLAKCPKCGEAATGSFDVDDDDNGNRDDGKTSVLVACVNCHEEIHLEFEPIVFCKEYA